MERKRPKQLEQEAKELTLKSPELVEHFKREGVKEHFLKLAEEIKKRNERQEEPRPEKFKSYWHEREFLAELRDRTEEDTERLGELNKKIGLDRAMY